MMQLTSVFELIEQGYSPATLAEAIKAKGVFGTNPMGTVEFFDVGSRQAEGVLDALAALHRFEDLQPGREAYEADFGPDGEYALALTQYGWLRDKLPDFGRIASNATRGVRVRAATNSDAANLNIIGGLLAIVLGEGLGVERHPAFSSQADVIRFLSEKMDGFQGISRRNLENKFADARRALKQT